MGKQVCACFWWKANRFQIKPGSTGSSIKQIVSCRHRKNHPARARCISIWPRFWASKMFSRMLHISISVLLRKYFLELQKYFLGCHLLISLSSLLSKCFLELQKCFRGCNLFPFQFSLAESGNWNNTLEIKKNHQMRLRWL